MQDFILVNSNLPVNYYLGININELVTTNFTTSNVDLVVMPSTNTTLIISTTSIY